MRQAESQLVNAPVAAIMLFTVAAEIARSALYLYLVQSGYESTVAKDLSYFVVLPVTAILMWPVLRENVPAMRRWFRAPASWPALVAYSLLLGVLFRIMHRAWLTAGIGFGWTISLDLPMATTVQYIFACPSVPLLALALIVQAIATPLLEEFMHRGYVLHGLLPRGNVLAVIVSAVFFGLMHRAETIIDAFLVGVVLAILTLRLHTLWCPIIVHATYNLVAIIDWACFHAIWHPAATTPRHAVIAWISVATIFACVALSLWLLRLARTGTQLAPRP